MAFYIPELSDRLNCVMVALLAFWTFRGTVQDRLPKFDITLLDWYLAIPFHLSLSSPSPNAHSSQMHRYLLVNICIQIAIYFVFASNIDSIFYRWWIGHREVHPHRKHVEGAHNQVPDETETTSSPLSPVGVAMANYSDGEASNEMKLSEEAEDLEEDDVALEARIDHYSAVSFTILAVVESVVFMIMIYGS